MPVVILDPQDSAPNVPLTFVPAEADGNAFLNTGQEVLFYQIPGNRDLTYVVPHPDIADEVETRIGPEGDIGRLDPLKYNDPVTGLALIKFDDVTGVFVAVARFPMKSFNGNKLAGSLC